MGILNIFKNIMSLSALIISVVTSLFSFLGPEKTTDTYASVPVAQKKDIFKPVIDKMMKLKLDTAFISYIMQDPGTRFDEKYVRINVLGTLKKADYSHNYNDYSISKSLAFLNENETILAEAEKKYGVPKEVITSILWVETRHGGFLGNNNIPSVFLSAALAGEPEYIEQNKKIMKENYEGSSEDLKVLEEKLEAKSKKKAQWALEQLAALEKMNCDYKISVCDLHGSWAGAFGMSQFLPSSYVSWAVDGNRDGKINLFNKHDAIHSVANYLKTNGWGPAEEQQRAAVYHYNHSNAYVTAVLKLADKLKKE